jgi:hypothetical protein
MNALRRCSVVLLLLPVFARGQQVNFNNSILAEPPDRTVYMGDMETPVVGSDTSMPATFVAQLYYGDDASNLNPITAIGPARFRPGTIGPGLWLGGNRTLTGFSVGDSVTLQVRAWDAAGVGRTYDQTRAAGGMYGESVPFTYLIPPAAGPSTNYYMYNFRSFSLNSCRGVRLTNPTNGAAFNEPASITFQVESLNASANITNLTYWLDGQPIRTANVPPFEATVTNLAVGYYLLRATSRFDNGDLCGSDTVLFRVMFPPNPVLQPLAYTALRGSSVTFTVSPGGSEPNGYAWFHNGNLITNAEPELPLTNLTRQLEGPYACVVSNAVGVSTSAPAVLKVRDVVIYANGQPIHTPGITSTAPVTISMVSAYERGTIFYTLDGSRPNSGSTQYLGAFTIQRTAFLRAVGYSADFFQSGEAERVYVLKTVPPPPRVLSAISGGGGVITANPAKVTYMDGETVEVMAQPDAGWSFLEWRGDTIGTNPVITLQMTADRCVKAIFATTLTTTVAGNGQIILDPPGGFYPWGTTVRLHAVPAASNYFVLWGNYASGSDNPLIWSMTTPNPAISSAFFPLASNQVTLTALVDGMGAVETLPATNRYTRGQSVILRAHPRPLQSFLGWSGGATGGNEPIVVTLDASRIITAHFTKIPQIRLGPECDANFLNENGFYATLVGAWSTRYAVQYSDLLGSWQPMLMLTNTYGTTQFVDSGATNVAQRFYRAVLAEP